MYNKDAAQMRSENERRPAVVASTCISSRCILYTVYYTYIQYTYLYLCTAYTSSHSNVRNKTSYETPSFHTSGTARNVPYTILTHSHIYICYYMLGNKHPLTSYFWVPKALRCQGFDLNMQRLRKSTRGNPCPAQ